MANKKECREMKQLAHGHVHYACPDCGSSCSAITMSPGLEVCNYCQTVGMIPNDMDKWKPFLPMMADYEIRPGGKKTLLGWHPASKPESCFTKK